MSTIDENDSTATELGFSEDLATTTSTGELVVGGGAEIAVDAPDPESVCSEWSSVTGELVVGVLPYASAF